jgi:hypothetical protein
MSKKSEKKPATQADVDSGSAVFFVPDTRSKFYDLGMPLPVEAILVADIEASEGECMRAGTTITVVQAEIVDDRDVLLGITCGEQKGVCMLNEVSFKSQARLEV